MAPVCSLFWNEQVPFFIPKPNLIFLFDADTAEFTAYSAHVSTLLMEL
jgi:hypothetical protein